MFKLNNYFMIFLFLFMITTSCSNKNKLKIESQDFQTIEIINKLENDLFIDEPYNFFPDSDVINYKFYGLNSGINIIERVRQLDKKNKSITISEGLPHIKIHKVKKASSLIFKSEILTKETDAVKLFVGIFLFIEKCPVNAENYDNYADCMEKEGFFAINTYDNFEKSNKFEISSENIFRVNELAKIDFNKYIENVIYSYTNNR